MLNQIFVVFVISIALREGANSFVIQDRQSITDMTQSTHSASDNSSTTVDAPGSAVVIDEEEIPPVQSISDENVTSTVKTEEKKFSKEPIPTSSSWEIDGEGRKKEAQDKNDGEGHTSSNDNNDEHDKFRYEKYAEFREEIEDDNTTNEDYDNDD